MKNIAVKLLMIASVIAMSACSSNNNKSFPSLVGNDSQEKVRASGSNTVTVNKSSVDLSKVTNTGTFVGQKVITFRNELAQIQTTNRSHADELQKIRNSILENTAQYNSNVSAIETKLQVGTTPGNPYMYDMLAKARNNVQTVSAQSTALENLSAKITSNATSTNFLLENIRSAFYISGAVDEDHNQLRTLQNEAEQVSVLINSLNTEASFDNENHQQYIIGAKTQLNNLANAIKVGNFQGAPRAETPRASLFTGKSSLVIEKPSASNIAKPAAAVRGKPIFSVKFSNDNVDYNAGLKASVEAALERKPSSQFDVVAISSSANQAKAQGYANKIFQEVVGIGVNPNNVNLGAKNEASASTPEIQVYVR